MAKMYPEVYPGVFDLEDPELIVYEQLRRLSDRYAVFYSRRFKGGLFGLEECEIDFIVSNHKDVLLCIEVKGGTLAYDGRNDSWQQNGVTMRRSPDRQASAATHALIRHLDEKVRNVGIDWALCFPQCCIQPGLSLCSLPSEHIIDERKLRDIESAIHVLEVTVRRKFNRKGMSPREGEILVASLTLGIGFVQKLGVRIARERNQLIQVTEEQLDVLVDLDLNRRSLVRGAAGTGKTILAQEFTKRLLRQRKKVLLLFYNRGIARKVRYAFAREDNVVAGTFSGLAKRLIEKHDPDWWDKVLPRDDDFWRMRLPLRLLDLSENLLPKFDAVVVDEGQDFKPEWYEFLERLLGSRTESHFCAFLDEHQDIFGHWHKFPSNPHPARKLLRRNCRNTRRIVDYISKVYPTGMVANDRSPLGADVVERVVTSRIHEQTQLLRDIRDLLQNDEISPGSIVILINRSKKESCLGETKRIAGLPLKSTYGRHNENARCIHYSTIDIFKGLEADVIFIVDCDAISPNKLMQQLYVQGTRARHLLYIYRKTDG